jgi:hypothetical protein
MAGQPVIRHGVGQDPQRIIKAVAVQHGQQIKWLVISGGLAQMSQQLRPPILAWPLITNAAQRRCGLIFGHVVSPIRLVPVWDDYMSAIEDTSRGLFALS